MGLEDPKPNVLVQNDRVECPGEGLPPVKDIAGSDKSLAAPENSGGLGIQSFGNLASGNLLVGCSYSFERGSRPEDDEDSLKGEMGSIEKLGWSSKLPEVAEGPSSSLEIRVPVSTSAPSVLGSGPVLPIPVSGVLP